MNRGLAPRGNDIGQRFGNATVTRGKVLTEKGRGRRCDLGLGDLNADGLSPPVVSGDVVRMVYGSPVLIAGSDQQAVEAAVEQTIQRFLGEELRVDSAPVARDCELVRTGLLDSMDLVRLAEHLEQELGVSIPDADIHDENFGSVERALGYLRTLQAR